MWFESLTGFREQSPAQVRANLIIEGHTLTSAMNGRKLVFGELETPTLGELRARAKKRTQRTGKHTLREVVADVQHLHQEADNAGAMFQVASQFNLLEMVSPQVTPEHGVGIYEHDRTQGPACAIAAGAGTIYRNYFVEVNGQIGQSAKNQIDCLYDLGVKLGNTEGRLWTMKNGYALPSEAGLQEVSERLSAMNEEERDALRGALRIGVQWDTQVTLGECVHQVTQAYCSALPVAYSMLDAELWEAFAQLVLEASYEATLWAGVLNAERTGNRTVYLTLLGGGAFGNQNAWIFAAMHRALKHVAHAPLDVAIVSYGASNPRVQALVNAW